MHNINSYEYRAAAAIRHDNSAERYTAERRAAYAAADNSRRAAYAAQYADAIAAAERRAALGL